MGNAGHSYGWYPHCWRNSAGAGQESQEYWIFRDDSALHSRNSSCQRNLREVEDRPANHLLPRWCRVQQSERFPFCRYRDFRGTRELGRCPQKSYVQGSHSRQSPKEVVLSTADPAEAQSVKAGFFIFFLTILNSGTITTYRTKICSLEVNNEFPGNNGILGTLVFCCFVIYCYWTFYEYWKQAYKLPDLLFGNRYFNLSFLNNCFNTERHQRNSPIVPISSLCLFTDRGFFIFLFILHLPAVLW